MGALIAIPLLGCGSPPKSSSVQLAPLGDVSLREAQVRIDGAFAGDEGSQLGYYGVAAGDLDHDGLADLAATDFAVGVRVGLLGRGGPFIVDLGQDAVSVAIVDRGADAVLAVGERYQGVTIDRRAAGSEVGAIWSVDRVQLDEVARITHLAIPGGGTMDYQTRSLGDVDGDGRDDLGVQLDSAGPAGTYGTGQVWILTTVDRDQELDADAVARLIGPTGWSYAGASQASGDLDGDGLSDQVLSLEAYYSGADAVVATAPFTGDLLLDPEALPSLVDLPGQLASGGDLDGDGLDDLVVAGGDATVFGGPIAGLIQPDDAVAVLRGHGYPELPLLRAAIADDVDGDGMDDLLASSPGDLGAQAGGVAAVWYGPVAGSRDLVDADARLLGESPGDEAGTALVGPGDTDGDGFGDLVIGAVERGDDQGAVYVVSGGPTSVP